MDSNWKYFLYLKSKKLFFDFIAILLFLFFAVTLNYNANAQENCGNGVDDDGDGLIDCLDPNCNGNPPSSSFFNTANNGSGGVRPGGSPDLSWKVSSTFAGPYTPAYVMRSIPGVYYSSPWPNSDWISYSPSGFHSTAGGPVNYYFKISFLLPCFNPCGLSYLTRGTFCLTLDYFADNSVYEIWVNGVPQSPNIGTIPVSNPYYNIGYNSTGRLTASLCQNWQPGLNEIIVRVCSGPDYIGLLVQSSINSFAVPTASISTSTGGSTTTVCQNDPPSSIIFTGSGRAPFTFNYNLNGVNQTVTSNGNTVTVPVPTNTAGTFTYSLLSVQDANSIGCPNAISNIATVIVNPLPLTDAGNNQTICSGTSTTLTASGGTYYQWNGGPASAVYTVSPLSTTTYTVIANLNGCNASDEVTISVNTSIAPTYNSVAICSGTNYQLANGNLVSTPGIYQDTLQSSLGCDSILFTTLSLNPVYVQNISASICDGTNYQLPTGNNVHVPGIYYDTLLTLNGCDSIIITALSLYPVYTQDISASICQGTTYQLANGNLVSNTGTYHDTLQTSFGCDSIIITSLSFFPQVEDSINITDAICYESNSGEIELFAFNSMAPYSFHLFDVGTNSTGIFSNLSAGNYFFTITDNNGCNVSGNCVINQPDKINILVNPIDTMISEYDIVNLVASSNYANAIYNWSPTTFLSCDTCSSTTSSPNINVTYDLTVTTSSNGFTCSADTAIIIRIKPNLFAPNAFTPNSDGLNDTYLIFCDHPENISDFKIQIFNRWGENIFENNNLDFQWSGNQEQSDTYVNIIKYKIKGFKDEQIKTGTVTIVR